jgi:hypothetical protein
MISDSSAANICKHFKTKQDCATEWPGCTWSYSLFYDKDTCQKTRLAAASSFVSLEADVGVDEGHYLGAEDYIVGENIDSSWKSGSGDAAFSDEYGYYDYEDEDMEEDEDVDASLDLEDTVLPTAAPPLFKPNANVSNKKRSYLRRTNY